MALQSRTITVGADKDVNNGGKNYVGGQVIYIKNEAGVLAPIFRDIGGLDPIAQNTISNVTNAKGQFTFFIEEGNYTAEYNDQSTPLFVFGADYFNNQIDFVTSQILSNTQPYSAGNFTDGFTFTELNQYGNATVNDGGADYSTTFWYIGGTLPHIVAPLTNPRDFPLLYQQRDFNSAEFVATKTTENAQDFIDSFALKIFQSPTDGLTEINTRTLLGGEVYEVRKASDDSLAAIYSDKEGDNEIAQDGTANVSGSDGVVDFYIADGDYYISYFGIKYCFGLTAKRITLESGETVQSEVDRVRLVDEIQKPIQKYSTEELLSLVQKNGEPSVIIKSGTSLAFAELIAPITEYDNTEIFFEFDYIFGELGVDFTFNGTAMDDLDRANPSTIGGITAERVAGNTYKLSTPTVAAEKSFAAWSIRALAGQACEFKLKSISIVESGLLTGVTDFSILAKRSKWTSSTSQHSSATTRQRVSIPSGQGDTTDCDYCHVSNNGSSEFGKPPYDVNYYLETLALQTNTTKNVKMQAGKYYPHKKTVLYQTYN